MLSYIFDFLKFRKVQKEWRKRNKHNLTYVIKNGSLKIDNIEVGNGTYGGLNVFNCTDYKLSIGNYCSIAKSAVLYLELLIERQLYPRIPLKPMCYMLEKKLFLRGD